MGVLVTVCSPGVRFDLRVSGPEGMSRDELVVVVHRQADRITAQDQQITGQADQLAELMEANEALAGKLARLEHLLSRNSGNSSMPPSKDDDPGKPPSPERQRGRGGSTRSRGKQSGAPGSHLAWSDRPDDLQERFPEGSCGCGADLSSARDLGVVDRYQSHEIPEVSAWVIQYDQHQVECDCGAVHTANRPAGSRAGPVGYGPNLQAFAVYLLVVQFVPAHRVVALLESLTGAAPSVGFVHGMLGRAAGLLAAVHDRVRALIVLAHAVCCDETPLRVGPRTPKPGRKKAERYLLVFCTDLYTHYLLGDRSLATFKDSVLTELGARPDATAIIVHDRYQNYDSTELGALAHQLCAAHLLRDLDGAAQVYPDAVWPPQIAQALRGLIHEANLAREHGLDAITDDVAAPLLDRFRHGVLVGLSATTYHGERPGERKARNLLEVLRDRPADVLRFVHDLAVPPTSNQAERDLRPSKVQQNTSGRLTSEDRTRDRYTIRGYVSTATKHGLDAITVLRDALTGHPWIPALPAAT
ncbi:MAG TPA: IS66 family transposase [Pseudonocardiaceae bacterium]|jgi:hypothetical protein|nr:IS66 family transposase [Pseudonocardiaceae bacterium]